MCLIGFVLKGQRRNDSEIEQSCLNAASNRGGVSELPALYSQVLPLCGGHGCPCADGLCAGLKRRCAALSGGLAVQRPPLLQDG